MSTTAFVPASLPDTFVTSGSTTSLLNSLTITSNEPPTSAQLIATILSPNFTSFTTTDLGKVNDSTGGGTSPAANEFLEDNVIAGVSGNEVLKRLQYVAPKLDDGQSIQVAMLVETATSLTAGGALDSNVATLTFNVDVVTPPSVTNGVATQPDAGAVINPFSTMKIADADFKNTGTDTLTITVTDKNGTATDADGTLTGSGLSKTGVGTYSLPNADTPANLTSTLNKLSFNPSPGNDDKTTNFEVDVTDVKANLTHKDTTTSVITPGSGKSGPDPDPDPGSAPMVVNTTTGKPLAVPNPPTPYTGPVNGPTQEYINVTSDSLNVTCAPGSDNWFIHTGSGMDGIKVDNGINILDGGTGSNFLVDGTGQDTNFVDARSAPSDIWSTVVGFKTGDDATMFGITPQMFNVAMVDNDGAAGFTGLTFHATAAGSPEASLTLTGFTQADLTSGKLTMGYGNEPDGTPFLHIHAT